MAISTFDGHSLLHALQDIIYKNFNDGKRTVILIDEAQIIKNKETLEEIRLFLNFQLNNRFLITLVLIGQPELLEKIKPMPQLQQRLGIKYHLLGLDLKETEEYIKHRLSVAGARRDIFAKKAFEAIYSHSEGIPRKINNICDMSLLISFGQEVKIIDKKLVEKLAADLEAWGTTYAKNV